MRCISSVRAIWWNTVQYFEIGQSVVDRGSWYWYSGETVEAEKYHRQENKYRRQIQRWGQHDWLAEKNTEIGKVKVGKIIPTFFLLLSKREKNYYSCGCAKLTFPLLLAFVLENQFSISTFSTLVNALQEKKLKQKLSEPSPWLWLWNFERNIA